MDWAAVAGAGQAARERRALTDVYLPAISLAPGRAVDLHLPQA